MREFKVSANPYDDKKIYYKSTVSFEEGLTVLCGCNGSGKSTLLKLMKSQLSKDSSITLVTFDNYGLDGGSNLASNRMFYGDVQGSMSAFMSSEGERIMQTVGYLVEKIGSAIRNKKSKKEMWVLMDAVGSGLSIDGIDEIKDFIGFVRGENTDIQFYFIVCTNEYEFAEGEDCIDVTTFRHLTFKDYNDYRKFILKTRDKKNKRYRRSAMSGEQKKS